MIRNMGISDARTDGTQVDYRAAQSQLKMLSSQTFFGKFDIENVHFWQIAIGGVVAVIILWWYHVWLWRLSVHPLI